MPSVCLDSNAQSSEVYLYHYAPPSLNGEIEYVGEAVTDGGFRLIIGGSNFGMYRVRVTN